MSENNTFHSSFLGFNRVEVMKYINLLMAEKDENFRRIEQLEVKSAEDEKTIAILSEKVKNAADCANCDLAKQNEVKIGAAMLDARRFSDLLVDEANEKSAKMYEAAAVDAYDSSEKAAQLADKIRATAEEYAAAFNALIDKMAALSESLGEFGNVVTGQKNNFETSFEDTSEEENAEVSEDGENASDFGGGWKEPFAEGVFDPDFNFLDADDSFEIKIDVDA